GVVVYLRQEGRGIGLINKLKAYSLQDTGLDTVEANERLGFPADLRNYGVGAQILSDLGVHRLRLITNNPRKIAGLGGYGLHVEDRVPLVMDPGAHNAAYLAAKRTKLGHLMGEGPSCPVAGPTAVLSWQGRLHPAGLASLQERLLDWATRSGLKLETEQDPRLLALLNQPQLAVQLSRGSSDGLDPARLWQGLELMAAEPGSRCVGLLLSPEPRVLSHPSALLEAQRRPLVELQPGNQNRPRVDPGALILWRR
ncbi:MAG: GTP cyclohydrolase II RibA, partial [Synechococcaceae cyanobacterium]|nr:GTP cyclohydrolase II RibA [Synechococcaceae cyanobacterium]